MYIRFGNWTFLCENLSLWWKRLIQ